MALSDDEIRSAYNALSEAARKFGLHWVLEQVEERIAFGKTAVKKVKITTALTLFRVDEFTELEGLAELRKPSTSGTTFIVANAYSPAESLELLVDALLMAVPSVHETARHVLTEMREFGPVASVVFVDDRPSDEPRELDSANLDSHRSAVLLVEKLLKELKRELQDASSVDSSH